jgi:CDP-diacylglycerol--glycerol-3-phosphate 3-phosphatidyltransferase
LLSRLRVRPNQVTFVGLAFSVAVPFVAVLRGWWLFAAAGLVLLAGVADSVDGAVAAIATRVTRLGAYYDAMADRLGEMAWLIALWLLGAPVVLVVAAGALIWLHEYARAQANASAKSAPVPLTVAERAMRVLLVFVAFVAGGITWLVSPHLTPGAVTVVLALLTALSLLALPGLLGSIRAALRAPAVASAGPVERERTSEDGERARVARESEVAQHIHKAEPAVEPPRP